MKRFLTFTLFFIMAGIMVYGQNLPVFFTGMVMDQTTGAPVANYAVTVEVMSGGLVQTSMVTTGEGGFYMDTVATFGQGSYEIYTLDCVGDVHSFSGFFNPGNMNINHDFIICADSLFTGCIAHFSYEIVPNPAGVPTVYFTDESSGSIDNWFWNFGDGNYSTEQNPMHVYNAIGPFNVCLTISSNDSTCSDTWCNEVNLNGGGGDCENMFWYQTWDNVTFEFMGEAMPFPADDFHWDFGDGTTGDGPSVLHTYDPSLYDSVIVHLTTFGFDPTTGDTCEASSSQPLAIGGGSNNCQNWFTYSTNDMHTFQFAGDGSPVPTYYYWDFGDGQTSTGSIVNHTYEEGINGYIPVTLTTFHAVPGAADSCVAISEQMVMVGGNFGDCMNWFTFDQTGDATFVFNGESVPPALEYFWTFGDGSTGQGQFIEHTYNAAGGNEFTVTLTTYHSNPVIGDSCIATSSQQVILNGSGGDCDNFFVVSPLEPNSFHFMGESVPQPADYWFWDFGDGNTATGQAVDHSFDPTISDVYLVTLTTFIYGPNVDSCTATSTQEVLLNGNSWDCENWFWYESEDNITFNFTGESFPVPADSYSWDFGDGTTASGQQVTHTYDPAAGNEYVVTLTTFVFDPATGDSCMAQSMQDVWFNGNSSDCENMFWYNSSGNFTFDFMGESFPDPIAEFFWDFGDGSFDYGPAVTHTFDPSAGDVFSVCLTTVSYGPIMDSCIAVSCQDVVLNAMTGKEVYGHIYADNMPADFALVGLFGMNNNGTLSYNFTVTEPGTGFYFFDNVPDGDYYIFASLTPQSGDFYDYFPTYFGDAIFWFDSELISLGEPTNPYEIDLVPITAITSGPGNISGTVTMQDSKAGPAENIMVMLMDAEGNPVRYMASNEQGEFSFDNLAYGTYKLTIEMPGVNSEIITVILDEQNQEMSFDFFVKNNSAFLGLGEHNSIVSNAGNVYPNPVAGEAWMELDLLKSTDVQVNVLNQLGQTVKTATLSADAGKQTIKITVSGLSEGMYILQLSTTNGEMIMRRFVK